MQSLIGQNIGPYQILEQVGMGGMATIYKAYQSSMDRYVAIKVLPQQMAAEDPTFLGRFEQEAKTIAKLEHRNILPVYDYGEAQGYAYLVMRYVEAGTLKDLIARGPVPIARAVRLIQGVAEALAYAHAQGVVHRDVKPSNVLIDAQDNAYLMDFGIAKLLSGTARFTGTDMLIGTPAYMSPEQAQGNPADARSDLYSLGVMLYEMVTGQAPYEAETPMAVLLKHIQAPLPPPRTIRHDLPTALERVILRAMAKDPHARYQSAADMSAALEQALSEAPTEQRTLTQTAAAYLPPADTTGVAVPQPWRGASPLLWVAGGVAMLAIIVIAAFLLLGGGGGPAGVEQATSPEAATAEAVETAEGGTAEATEAPTVTSAEATLPPTAVAAAEVPAGRAAWRHYLSASVVYDLALVGDQVYAATGGGLVRWTMDGVGTQFTPGDGLPFARINALAAAPDGSLWLGGDLSGIARVAVQGNALAGVEYFTFDDGLSGESVHDLVVDADGHVWAGMAYSEPGVDFYNGQTWREGAPIPMDDPALDDLGEHVNVVFQTADGATWLGMDRGVAIWIPAETRWVIFPTEEPVQVVHPDHEGNILVAAGEMLRRGAVDNPDPGSWEPFPINEGCWVNGLIQATDYSYWLTCNDVVIRYEGDRERRTEYSRDEGVPGYTTGALLEDSQGRLWVGTDGGLALFDGRRWIVLRLENDAPPGVMAFLQQTADGRLWAANGEWPGWAWSFDPASETWATYDLETAGINGFAVDASGDAPVLWITSWEGGLKEYRTADGRSRHYTAEDGLVTDHQTYAAALDEAGRVWIGVLEGVYRFDPQTGTFTLYQADADGEPLDAITHLYVDPDGVLWAGHRGWEPSSRADVAMDRVRLRLDAMRAAAENLTILGLADEAGTISTAVDALEEAGNEATDRLWRDTPAQERQTLANNLIARAEALVSAVASLTVEEAAAQTLVTDLSQQAALLPDLAGQFVAARLSDYTPEPNWVYRYDAETEAFVRLVGADSPAQSDAPYLADLNTDGAGGLWVTVNYDALYHWDGASWQRFSREDGNAPEGQQLSAVAVGPDGTPWLASPDSGLYTRDEFGWFLLPWDEGLGIVALHDLLVAADGTLWLGADNGLIHRVGEP